ncbi:hypothetical protein EY04_27820 [Pseudomonas chlororaphis]|uniref:fimbrial protein n=1 Tax=Pseudomonas chlororaphis TaxID=587753 RepID=UPI0004AC0AC9|nr:fimbrial protein [Pseudomonas chlororaphis]AIC22578.1 hypothetical protein EY04_27820 [Pseudomonas chlororaphis]
MNKKTLALCAITLAAPLGMANAATVVPGGTIQFKGTVVNAACAVDATSTALTVIMGQVRVAALDKGLGTQSSARTPFDIILDDCDTSISGNASVSFTGVTAQGQPTMAVAGIGGNASSGVGLQIFDATGQAIVLDGAAESVSTALNPGQNTLKFQAGHVSLSPQGGILPGDASANIDFKVRYF